jgi:N-acetylneuraminic acid mutarotase
LVLTDGHLIYYFGGMTANGATADSYRYDPAAQAWQPLPPMAQARAHSAGGFVTGQFYVVGGTDGAAPLDVCERFDPLTESWSPCPLMLTPRARAGAAVLLNNLYIFGGQVGAGPRYSETFDPNTGDWTRVETPMFEENSEWADMGVGNVETRVYVFGGRDGDTLFSDTYVLTPFTYQFFIPAAPSGGSSEEPPEQ